MVEFLAGCARDVIPHVQAIYIYIYIGLARFLSNASSR